ncbi:MAG: protein translocase subunit SecF [Acidobacteriota bacterium]
MLQVFTHANFRMMYRTKWYFMAFSALSILVSAWFMVTRGFNYGIDFAGGTAVQLKFHEAPRVEDLRSALEQAGLGDVSIQKIGDADDNEVLIRVEQQQAVDAAAGGEGGEISAVILEALKTPEERAAVQSGKIDLNMASRGTLQAWLAARLPDAGEAAEAVVRYRTEHGGLLTSPSEIASIPGVTPEAAALLASQSTMGRFALRSVDFVGPTAGRELMQNTAWLIVLSILGILVYVWIRFHKWMWGVTAIIALVHDVFITAGMISLTGKEFSLTVVAALLTILGYSINDTIVVFDRIRENLRLYREFEFEEIVNASVNQTLSRTLLTSLSLLVAIVALLMFGGEKLNPMSFCLLVGVGFGTYSSVFVAAALLVIAYRRLGLKYVKA